MTLMQPLTMNQNQRAFCWTGFGFVESGRAVALWLNGTQAVHTNVCTGCLSKRKSTFLVCFLKILTIITCK
jgi:hypothetical protein